jgi:ABC-type sugar transport system ATPase subunit
MIALENICWQAGDFSLRNVSIRIPTASYGVLMGRTGSGKTTLAEILCGLRVPTSGSVYLGGRDVSVMPASRRGIGYVPQDGALFPAMSVEGNLGFALKVRGETREKTTEAVALLAGRLGLTHLLERRPEHLSGGERQRVALGRALAGGPAALVLDEPLSGLDDGTREELLHLLKNVHKSLSVTVLHITHHREEAMLLADQVFRLEDGQVHG